MAASSRLHQYWFFSPWPGASCLCRSGRARNSPVGRPWHCPPGAGAGRLALSCHACGSGAQQLRFPASFSGRTSLDRPLRHPLHPGDGRHQPPPGAADRVHHRRSPCSFRGGRSASGGHSTTSSSSSWRAASWGSFWPRPLPLLPLLGGDADPHVLPDRHLGTRPADLLDGEVLPLHPGRLAAHAPGDHRPLPDPRRPDGELHLCARGTAPPPGSPRESPSGSSPPFCSPSPSRCRSFPLHTWLPDAHTDAPTAGSVDPGRAPPEDRRLRSDPLRLSRSSPRRPGRSPRCSWQPPSSASSTVHGSPMPRPT